MIKLQTTPHYENDAATIDDYLGEQDVHERDYQPVSGVFLVIIFAAVLALAHAVNTYMLFWLETSLFLNIVIHLVLVAVAAFVAVLMRRSGLDQRYSMLLLVTTPFLGVVGAIGTLMAALQSLFYLRFPTSFEEWYSSIFPRGEMNLPEKLAENIELGRDENPIEYHVIPFMDVMEVGSEAQKRQALSKMSASFSPRFAGAFKRALADDSSAIRVQAATAIARIENRFHERLLQIENLHKQHPENRIILRALALHCDDYAFTGLLDAEREDRNREKAKGYYMQHLTLEPSDLESRIRVGRLLVRMERDEEAVHWFRRCLDEGYQDNNIKIWYIETLYRMKDYEGLRQMVSSYQLDLTRYQSGEDAIADSVYLWAQAGLSNKQVKAES